MKNYQADLLKFQRLTFDDFKLFATDVNLSKYQKIGFPDNYREGKEKAIALDIIQKLGMDGQKKGLTFLDIGPGCTDLPLMLMDFCTQQEYEILLVDSEEMLNQLPNGNNISKYPGRFPENEHLLAEKYQNKVDYIVSYSVLHAVIYEASIFRFIDSAVSFLKPGGKFLLGDIPNISKRRRFFSTEQGVKFHQDFTQTDTKPEVRHLELEPCQIDDGIIFGILHRYRNFGFETYLLSQNENLPMYNRREDILICKT